MTRRTWIRERVIPLAWLVAAMLIFGGAAGLSVPKAEARTVGTAMHVTVTWIGGNCWDRGGVKPADQDARILATFIVPGCYDDATETQFVGPGQWYGANPDIGDAWSVACSVTNQATGRIILIDYARNGDGHDASCLGRI